MSQDHVRRRLAAIGVLPVTTVDDTDRAKRAVDALLEGGLSAVEVTLRTSAALDAIAAIAAEYPDVLLLAGTVRTVDQARRALDAGAQILVSPGTYPDVIHLGTEHDVPVLPGVCTPTEIGAALAHGVEVMKFFPAEPYGGVATLAALAAVHPEVGFVPTGGINGTNLLAYLTTPGVVACGGSWLVQEQLVSGGHYRRIAELARDAVATVRKVRG